MSAALHIVALGARTPVGLRVPSSAAAVRAGVTRLQEHPFLCSRRGVPLTLGLDGILPPELMGAARMVALAESALEEVLNALGPAVRGGQGRDALPVLIGVPEPRPGFDDAAAKQLRQALTTKAAAAGVTVGVSTVAGGHASALEGLRQAMEAVRSGSWPLCLVGGVDSFLAPEILAYLERERGLFGEDSRGHYPLGEGAGFLALATESTRRSLGLPSLAVVRAAQTGKELHLPGGGVPDLGEGLTLAVQAALGQLPADAAPIEGLLSDINGQRWRSEEWGFVALRLGRRFQDATVYDAPASSWGDVGAASGALLSLLAVEKLSKDLGAASRAMVWCSSEAGLRSVAILERGR